VFCIFFKISVKIDLKVFSRYDYKDILKRFPQNKIKNIEEISIITQYCIVRIGCIPKIFTLPYNDNL